MFFALCCVVSLVGTGGLLSYPICQNEVPPKIGRVKHYFQHIFYPIPFVRMKCLQKLDELNIIFSIFVAFRDVPRFSSG